MRSFTFKTRSGKELEFNSDDATLEELLTIDSLSPTVLSRKQKALVSASAAERVRMSDASRIKADETARAHYAKVRAEHKWLTPQFYGVRYLLAP